jgi:hypothetical protein
LLDSECPAACASGFGALVATTGGAINLVESALGVGLTDVLPGGSSGVILRTADGTITADGRSWIQPTQIQPEAALKAITGPSLLTEVPGLPTIADGALFFLTFPNALIPLLGTAGNPGVLIDAIADANPGEANELKSPINGSTITVDALGNPRVDGNGKRNIGGVQLTLAPHLGVIGIGDRTVDLSWSRPLDPDSGAITGYAVLYRPAGSADPQTRVEISGDDTLVAKITGLNNGTEYEFVVVGVNNVGDGPESNQVAATPIGSIGTPFVSAIPGPIQVDLSWTKPDSGGRVLSGYNIYYRLAGAVDWTYSQSVAGSNSLNASVTGLTGNTSYEFGVQAVATDGTAGELGVTRAVTTTGFVFEVTKVWVDEDQLLDQDVNATIEISCENVWDGASLESAKQNFVYDYSTTEEIQIFSPGAPNPNAAEDGKETACIATETSVSSKDVESDQGCAAPTVFAADDLTQGCTITNSVFYEGVPTLSQYALIVLALLMLGAGLAGFRRFA